jgi:hypothetical protein
MKGMRLLEGWRVQYIEAARVQRRIELKQAGLL